MTDVIVTGLPRAGATVAAALIDHLPNSVCFNAPEPHIAYARRLHGTLPFCKWLAGDFTWRRAQLMRQEPLPDFRAGDGTPLMDSHGDLAPVYFTRQLSDGFTLAMKHHSLYTALLPTLVQFDHFKIIAIIRHPLDVLASWQAHNIIPIGDNEPPGIARFWPEALAVAQSSINDIDRMVQLYELFLERYHQQREHIHIVKYEDLMQDVSIIPRLFNVSTVPAIAKNITPRRRGHSKEYAAQVRESLKKYGVFSREYYGPV